MSKAVALVKDLSRSQIIRFLGVGFICFLLEYFSFILLIDVFHVRYTDANLPSMCVAIIASYFLSRKLVFDSGRYNDRVTFILFIAFTLAGVVLNQYLLWFMVEKLYWNIKFSKVAAVGVVSAFNYVTKKYWVF